MKFSLDSGDDGYQVVSYGDGLVVVDRGLQQAGRSSRIELRRSGLLAADRIIENWKPRSVTELRPENFEPVFDCAPELLLLGTGPTLVFPAADVQRAVLRHSIGLEVMDTYAACRTYNVLMMEGRRVLAALIL